jgi:hypothetical protein
MNRSLVFTVLVVILLTGTVSDASAIPAFARKYDMSCNTCHHPAPRLKAYGEEFAGNGFVLADKEAPRAYRETGDDDLMLLREVPLALRLEGYARWQPETAGRTDMQWPYLVKLLSGGKITKDVSYYFYFFFGERGDVTGLEDAFIMFNNIFKSELDVYVGQFQVSDPLFKRELRMTLEDYQIYRVKPGKSSANLTYDRGIMFIYGFESGTDIVVEVLNGAGIGAADVARNFDNDKYKNTAFRLSQDLGEHLRLGGFAYWGREAELDRTNSLWMAGPDLTLSLNDVVLNVQYIERRDDNPMYLATSSQLKTRGAFAELTVTPGGDKGRWYGTALYNWVDSESDALDYHTATCHVGYLLARNFRLVGEYTYDMKEKANKLTVGFVSAF